ncbi:MAG: rod shape-determining protein MreC [Planctomycetota bacterium]|jgi:hypothetical protein
MKRPDLSGPCMLLAVSAAALVAGDRVPRAPLWNVWGRTLAPRVAGVAPGTGPLQGGPADPLYAAALLANAQVRRAIDALPAAQRPGAEQLVETRFPVRGIPAKLGPKLSGFVAGAEAGLYPAVPGSEAGAVAGAGVAVGNTLVGIVTSAERRVSYVRLLTDPDCRVAAAIVPPTPAEAAQRLDLLRGAFVVKGRPGSLLLRLDHVPAGTPVKVGDLICTSGARGFLSEGMIIGTVAGVENVDADATLEIDVAPAADFESLQAVAILVRSGSWEQVETPR